VGNHHTKAGQAGRDTSLANVLRTSGPIGLVVVCVDGLMNHTIYVPFQQERIVIPGFG